MTWLSPYLPSLPSLNSFPLQNELKLLYSARPAMRRRNTATAGFVRPAPPAKAQDRMWQWKAVDKALPVDRHPRLLLLAWHLALYAELPRASLSEHMRAHETTSCWRQRDAAATGTQAARGDICEDTLDRLEALARNAGHTVEKKVYTQAPYEAVIDDIRRHTDGGAPCLVLGRLTTATTPRLVYGIRQEGGSRHIETLDLGRGRSYLAQDTPAFWGATKGHAADADAADSTLSLRVYFFPGRGRTPQA